MRCFSGHTFALDLGTGRPLDPAAARQLLDRLVIARGLTPDEAESVIEAILVLGSKAADGGFRGRTNPEFRDLGCYRFSAAE